MQKRPRKRLRRHANLASFQAAMGKASFDQNIARVDALTDLYDSLPRAVKGRHSGGGADVLRAAVVLLHASLEDLLREVAWFRLPDGAAEALSQIPLAGCAPREKFTLGDLTRFRGMMVDQVLQKSVSQHYQSSVTFNSVSDVAGLLERSGIKQERVKRFYSALGEMIARRHHIVHRADVVDRSHGPQSLGAEKVQRWASATRRFGHTLLSEMSNAKLGDIDRDAQFLYGTRHR